MLRVTLKSLLARKVRLLLTGIAVVLGVAFVSGTYILSDTMSRTFDTLFDEINSGVDLMVRAQSGVTDDEGTGAERRLIPESLATTLDGIDGVARARGTVSGYAQMIAPTGKAVTTSGPPTLGVVLDQSLADDSLTVTEGRAPRGLTEMAMDRGTYAKYKFRLGSTVRVLFQGPPRQFTLVGTVKFGETDSLAGATLAVFDLETAQAVLSKPDGYDAIIVQTEPGANVEDIRARIAQQLPPGIETLSGQQIADENQESVGEFLGFMRTALLVFAGIALFVGAFIIVNTFTILVAQRSRELALLRALGASRAQVIRSVLLESLVVGVLASLTGLALGFLVALGIQGVFGLVGVDLPATSTVFRPRTAVVAIAVGVIVTLVASVLPARRAASVPPVAAMRDEAWTPPAASLRRRAIIGLAMLAGGILALALGLFGDAQEPLQVVGLGAFLVFLGVAVVSPLLARRLAGAIGRPFARFLGVPGRVSRENAMRNPRRTAATSAALMVGLALVGAVSVLATSVKASASDVIDSALGADFVIANFAVPHSPELASRLRKLDELSVVAEARSGPFKVGPNTAWLSGMDPSTITDVMRLTMLSGDVTALARGELLVSEEVSGPWSAVGNKVQVEFGRTGKKVLTVGGTYAKNELLGSYVVDIKTFDANFVQRLNDVTLVNVAPASDPARARAAIERVLTDFPNLTVRDQSEVKQRFRDQVNQLLGLIFALLGLAILIAFFGIVNTLALSVYERIREIGLLRAVGMSRRQVRRMVRYEAVIIAVLGAVLGLVVGVALGAALVTALKDEGITRLAIPGGQLASYLAVAALAGVVAAALPARRASRLDVLRALSYE